MYARLHYLWDKLSTGFWVVPVLMILGSIALAFLTLSLDHSGLVDDLDRNRLLYRGGPDGARDVLQTIAGSMITIAGVVFSITIVVLSLASNQMGPRLIRNFIHDGMNQVVLGTFTSTFTFCILVLLNVKGEENNTFVPQVSVTTGLALALLSIVILILFIHHIARLIQIPLIISTVSDDLIESVDRIFPLPADPPTPQDRLRAVAALPKDYDSGGKVLYSPHQGFLTVIDVPPLVALASEHDLLLRLSRHTGEFIFPGSELARVWSRGELPPDFEARLAASFTYSRTRSPIQDLGFSFSQLVEIGVRALSPSTNDPTSAMSCLDHLAMGLTKLAQRTPPFPFHYDDQGRVRVVELSLGFEKLAEDCLTPLRVYGKDSLPVMLHFFYVLEKMAPAVPGERERTVLTGHAVRALDSALEHAVTEKDRRLLEEAFTVAKTALDAPGR